MQGCVLLYAVRQRGRVQRVDAQDAVRDASKGQRRPAAARPCVVRRLGGAVEEEDGAAVAVVGRPASSAGLDHLSPLLAGVGLQDAHRRQGQPPRLAHAARGQHGDALLGVRADGERAVGQ